MFWALHPNAIQNEWKLGSDFKSSVWVASCTSFDPNLGFRSKVSWFRSGIRALFDGESSSRPLFDYSDKNNVLYARSFDANGVCARCTCGGGLRELDWVQGDYRIGPSNVSGVLFFAIVSHLNGSVHWKGQTFDLLMKASQICGQAGLFFLKIRITDFRHALDNFSYFQISSSN